MESAIELMRAAPSEGAVKDPVDDPAAASTEPAKEPAKEAQSDAETPVDDGLSPDEKAAKEAAKKDTPADQGDVNDEDVEQASSDALPPIEPPSSWKTEEKDVFKSLPRAAQEAIARREQDRTTELRNLQNSQAEQRKTVEAEVNKLKGIADKVSEYVSNEVKSLAKQFPEIKSEADVTALAERDPARFSLFQARLMEFNAARAAQAEAQQVLTQKANEAQQETMKQARDALITAFPTWQDKTVAVKEMTELQDYAIKEMGVPEQAARTTIDPYVYKLAQKAMLYDRAQAAKAKALTRDPPRTTVKPGTSSTSPRGDAKAASRQSQLTKLDRSGDIEDARGLLMG